MDAQLGSNESLRVAAPEMDTARSEVGVLLRAGAYDELARLLAARPTAGTGEAAVLGAARQLCLACVELRGEQDNHRQAMERVARLEDDTRRRIEQLLEPIWEVPPGGPVAGAPPVNRWQALWRRIVLALQPRETERAQTIGAMPLPSPARDDLPLSPAGPPVADESLPPPTELPAPAADAPGRDDTPAADLHVYCLGRFRVFRGDRAVDEWTGNKSRSLFKYLLIHRAAPVHAELLLDAFWRDSTPEAARRSLYQTVYLVRQTFQAAGADRPVVIQSNGGYQLNPELAVWVDSDAFLCRYREGVAAAPGEGVAHVADNAMIAALQAAETLYEGDFLAEDLYEEWPVARREELRDAYLDLLDRLSRHFYDTGEDGLCVVYCRKLLEIDACREDIHRRLMRVFARRGERTLALRQYHRCVDALRSELDVEPLAETVSLYEKILENGFHFRPVPDLRGN